MEILATIKIDGSQFDLSREDMADTTYYSINKIVDGATQLVYCCMGYNETKAKFAAILNGTFEL